MHAGIGSVLAGCCSGVGGFAGRPDSPSPLTSADLVLVAGRKQRAHCVTLTPSALRRTFP
jgi:hypothetical protein